MNKLLIDTSTSALILILFTEDLVIDFVLTKIEKDHTSFLLPSIEALLNKSKLTIKDIDAFCVTDGPGSYTGVRIGVTVAKILSYSLDKPLYKISTLKLISASYQAKYIVPLIDARRGNVFSTLYQIGQQGLINRLEEKLHSFEQLMVDIKSLTNEPVLFVGLDAAKFKDRIHEQDQYAANLETDFKPERIIHLDFERVENVHAFVPNYQRLAEAELNLLK